ncbi:MAG: xanthine phosphoribosyltransferase [Erysipelotrichaceae bacterium]|nr:xanthine phosphoribosyltransferase [Erysipelotrichaceae bacterium]
MKLLEERIRKEGKILPGDILKIDCFLNHQIDTALLQEIASEFHRLFENSNITKILTVEASGIAIAVSTAFLFNNVPVVFAKKGNAANLGENVYHSPVYSYTRGAQMEAHIDSSYLNENDRVLIVDDFMANGQAVRALIDICDQAGAKVVGCGIVVEKAYQKGGEMIRSKGIRVESLARVKSMSVEDGIEFVED